jgi:hypothetical protein
MKLITIFEPSLVTICLNSMHSRDALNRNYPGLIEIMPLYYGQEDRRSRKFENVSSDFWRSIESLDFNKVISDTASNYWVQAKDY